MSRHTLPIILLMAGIFIFARYGLTGGPEITPQEVLALLKATPPPPVIDIRDRAAFDQSRIAGARPVPLAELKDKLEALKLPKMDAVIVYDEDDTRVREATRLLYESGYQGGLTLKGGLAAWRAAGLPLEKSVVPKP